MAQIAITVFKLIFFGIGSHLYVHLATFKLFNAIEMVTASFVNSHQIVTVFAPW